MKNIWIILIVFILGCAARHESSSIGDKENSKRLVDIKIDISSDSENILFEFVNRTDNSIFIYNPQKLYIERRVDDTWEKLRILSCPCGAPCARPPDFYEITDGNNYSLSWDRFESWCGEKNELGIKKTEKEKVEKGIYRIRILYGTDNISKKILYKEFEIK